MQKQKETKTTSIINHKQVVEYLENNPDFFLENPEVLQKVSAPNRSNQEGVVDLQHFMIGRLQDMAKGHEKMQKELIATSRNNLSIQQCVHDAVLTMIDARSLHHLLELVTTEVAVLVDVDVIAICFERSPYFSHDIESQMTILKPGMMDKIFLKNQDILLRSHIQGDSYIYDFAAGLVRSEALSRVEIDIEGAPQGFIAFGSRDPMTFYPHQGSELLHFLTHVFESCMERWIAKQSM